MKSWMVELKAGWNRIVIETACKTVKLVGMRIGSFLLRDHHVS